MKQNYTLHLCYILCVLIVLLVYPVKNYSAIVSVTHTTKGVGKVEIPVAQEDIEILHGELLFKY
jgi:hypothetical protein